MRNKTDLPVTILDFHRDDVLIWEILPGGFYFVDSVPPPRTTNLPLLSRTRLCVDIHRHRHCVSIHGRRHCVAFRQRVGGKVQEFEEDLYRQRSHMNAHNVERFRNLIRTFTIKGVAWMYTIKIVLHVLFGSPNSGIFECDNRQTIQTKLRHVDIHSHWLTNTLSKHSSTDSWNC